MPNSAAAQGPDGLRSHVRLLLTTIAVSRIIVVDDEYAPTVEDLIGICTVLDPAQAAKLPHFRGIDFQVDAAIWGDTVHDQWEDLDGAQRRELLELARAFEAEVSAPRVGGGTDDTDERVDTRAAKSLEEILGSLNECEYVTLDLYEWRERAAELLADDRAANTVVLFDRDFRREKAGTEHEGLKLIREFQNRKVGCCGLITHTVSPGTEYDAWERLADEHNLLRDKFVVIAKEPLTKDSPDYYGFLGMLRLVALSERYARVKSAAWGVFEQSVDEAKEAVERLSVLDFDKIVFGSSRRESVWEPDTLFRVFGILMRREARERLYQTPEISAAFAEARRVSAMPEEIAAALSASSKALRIQRFESYESADQLNQYHVPIELGDIFEGGPTGRRYILLVQPCDLVVRGNGRRNYEDEKYGRVGAFVELVVDPDREKEKESWGELPFYHEDTGRSAFADFAKVHQVQLAVLDLCVLRTDGAATIEVGGPCPELLIEPWKERCKRLQRFFKAALTRYNTLEKKQLSGDLKSLALPAASTTVRLPATAEGNTVRYDLKRVMRLQQPRSGALLTAFTQYQARVAFEHPLGHRVPIQLVANGKRECDQEEETSAKE